MQYASVWRRAVAAIIDLTVFPVIAGVVETSAWKMGISVLDHVGVATIFACLLWLTYYVVLEATTGKTIGKLLVGVRVVTVDEGRRIGWRAALIRNAIRLLDIQIFYLITAIAVSSSRRRQRLGDRAAGTTVVRG